MLELVNTSLPNGLIAGTHGFATVAMTKGLPDALRTRLESLCAYTHKTSAHDASYYSQNPVNWFHAVLPQGEHVVGRVAASDFDYTGRTNRLARLLVFPGREMPAVGGVAILQAESARLSAPWSGEPRHLPTDKEAAARLDALQPPAFSSPANWTALFGPDGAQLAQRFAWQLEKNLKGGGKPIYFKTSAAFDQSGTKLLGLFADVIDLLPAELRASVTFSTYPDALPAGTNCLLRGAFDGDRNFAIASSTQPWVDCEHAKVVHPEMLPSEAEQAPKAAVSGKKEASAAAPQSIHAPDAASGQRSAPLRPRQLASAHHHTPGGGSPYPPPPRRNNNNLAIIVAACLVLICALSLFFVIPVVCQDGEKKKREKRETEALAKVEAPQQSESPAPVIEGYKITVGELVHKLKDMKNEIPNAENLDSLDSFEKNVSTWKDQESKARNNAELSDTRDDELQKAKNEFDGAVADVEKAINGRRDKLEKARRAAEATARADKTQATEDSATADAISETIAQEPSKPLDTRPAFCHADAVMVLGLNELKATDFIQRYEKMTVFYYADGERKNFASEEVSTHKMGTSYIWLPKPEDMVKKAKGYFTIWYCERDKTAYWLWNLPKNADKGGKWFCQATNEKAGQPATKDLKQEVFGESTEAYEAFKAHLGQPIYTVTRSSPESAGGNSQLEDAKECHEDVATAELFKPTVGQVEKAKQLLETQRNALQKVLDDAKQKVQEKKDKVKEVEAQYGQLEKATKEYEALVAQKNEKEAAKNTEKNKDKKKKLADAVEKLKGPIQSKRTERDGLANTLSEQMWRDLGIPANDTSAFKRPNVKELQERWEEYKAKIEKLKTISLDEDPKYKNAKKEFAAAEKALRDFDANFDKLWRKVAEESLYAVTAVKGAMEPGSKTR